MKPESHERYLVKSLVHASAVLGSFRTAGETLRLRDIVQRTGLTKGTCFRLLYTLHHCGLLEKVGENLYRLVWEPRARRRYRIGYAAQGQDTSFPREVLNGLLQAAEREQVELIVVDNRYQPKVALRNADHLVREKVDLVIEFQTDEAVAPAIAAKYLQAGIPMIAIDIPHPGATYFGANNYEAGLIAGRHLGRWAKKHWLGQVDEILLIELARAGSVPRARIRGVLAGIREVLREAENCPVVSLDGDGQFRTTLERVRSHLRTSPARRILVGAANDPSALGAVRAFEEAGRGQSVAVVGQNAEPEARAELRRPRSPLIGSVAYFPEKYGDGLIRLALDILARKPVPPAVFMKHQLITPDNVDHYYPNDRLLETVRAPDAALQAPP
ncbi:MAG: substrate-binding domain-containing protein [Bryobacterales bacterium]|nr:substrate-binding domain-containing protein [Bryobacteraceae bacterium]MDW8354167.1 substrate-binding domain-containing protein [Bryobacterales bacterium]